MQVSVRPSRNHRRAADHNQVAVFDAGSGASFAETAWLRSIGAKIEAAPVPLIFHAFVTDAAESGGEAQRATHTASIEVTAGSFTQPYRFWCVDGSPARMLVGRDNMRASDGKALCINPDPDAPTISFNDGPPLPAAPDHRAAAARPQVLLAEAAAQQTVPPRAFELATVTVPACGCDFAVPEQKAGGLHVPDLVIRSDDHGSATLLVFNPALTPVAVHADSTMHGHDATGGTIPALGGHG